MRYKKHDVLFDGNEKGTVLLVVLVSLLVTIILGIVLMKSAAVESKIAGNELKSQKEFYLCEAAGEVAKTKIESVISTVILDENNRSVDMSEKVVRSDLIKDVKVRITLTYLRRSNPPVNSGMSPSSAFANYYVIESTVNGKTIKKGVWKTFPKIDE